MSADADIVRLSRWLDDARAIVGFTGAGISTESGVPDFRSPGSPWLSNRPVPFDAFVASEAMRVEAWRRKFHMDDLYAGASPSAGHRFLARLIERGKSPGLITQNIDGLHQAAGVPPGKIAELHGNGTYAACLACGCRFELEWVRREIAHSQHAPVCLECGGLVKSGTISFGQPMPAGPMRHAHDLAQSADLFLIMGSSLVVYPAASFPILAKRNGSRLVIINREPTPLDELADLVINAGIGEVVARIENRNP